MAPPLVNAASRLDGKIRCRRGFGSNPVRLGRADACRCARPPLERNRKDYEPKPLYHNRAAASARSPQPSFARPLGAHRLTRGRYLLLRRFAAVFRDVLRLVRLAFVVLDEALRGRRLRFALAMRSSSASLIDFAICFDAPRKRDFGVLPRLAESAAPAAFCCCFDFAGISSSHPRCTPMRTVGTACAVAGSPNVAESRSVLWLESSHGPVEPISSKHPASVLCSDREGYPRRCIVGLRRHIAPRMHWT